MKFSRLSLPAISLLITACGGGSFNIDQDLLQPKIVIQATLFPHQKVDKIKIMRNFPLGEVIQENDIIVSNARADIFDENENRFALRFNPATQLYEHLDSDLVIDYGKSYTLEVQATIDGKDLSARSTTTIPETGFEILESKSILGSRPYRQRDENGDLIDFNVTFNRSRETTFYAVSIVALDADISSFIYENPFGDFDEGDVRDDFFDFKFQFTWIQDTPTEAGESTIDIFSFFTWFFGEYQVIVYAADRNFKDFLQTHEEVQEIDGNFHEPAFHIEGDGIGVFGSAIADTAFFTVLRD